MPVFVAGRCESARIDANATLPALTAAARAAWRWLRFSSSFCLRISRRFLIVSRSVAIRASDGGRGLGTHEQQGADLAGRKYRSFAERLLSGDRGPRNG